ncbi:hypothetical protein PIB30_055827 [Stylosanthes scabra]|uniref:Uncharacterized protein n=1 Tax=Stylosanthes scabra TaxID=79078 RepID=A0ABU6XHT8_9FABA|nr:hypothetical protein [Stylosanthes scabra]
MALESAIQPTNQLLNKLFRILLSPGPNALDWTGVGVCDPTTDVPPTSRCVRMLHVLRRHLVQQWPSRFCCNPFVPFALFGPFRSELRLFNPETLKHTYQDIVRSGKQFKT